MGHSTATEQDTDLLSEKPRKPSPASLANLRPPWKKGVAQNPGGKHRDGSPATHPAHLRKAFIQAWETGDIAQKFIARWFKDAISGPVSIRARARDQVLERFWPVIQDAAQREERVVNVGVRLELSPSGAPQAVLVATQESKILPAQTEGEVIESGSIEQEPGTAHPD